ncbi:MAG TPA: serine/threonine-protein kinase, partial [Chthonomonadales bacterium]|nr:serine/threonine-protein kinase [Chthonomonadales bacterium]
MPFLPGGTLRARIRRGPLTLDETCRALSEIADALDYVHSQGIIHRDIKASNVLIDSDGGYYLADFGIARITSDLTHMTTTGNVLGTVDYVAPELFEVDRKANAFSDLYSLGVLLYEMVTGRLPFIAENQIALVTMHMRQRPPAPRGIDPRIPAAVERVMLKALEKRPEQRYHSAAELARAFCLAVNADDVMLISPASATPGLLAPVFKQEQLVLSPHDVGTADFISPIYEPAELVAASSLAPGRDVPAAPSYVPVSAATSRAARRARPRDTRPFYRHPLFVLVVVLLAFTIIAGSLAVLFLPRGGGGPTGTTGTTPADSSTRSPSLTATPNLTATAIAAQNATATASARASASARATATAEAQASATAGVILTATSGQPTYQDALNNPNNQATLSAGWDTTDNCVFQSDGYHDTASSNYQGCKEANYTYTNVAVTVTMHIVSGQSGGIFFRMHTVFPANLGSYAGYLFEASSAGQYRVLSSGNYDIGSPTVLLDWTASSALRQGNATNLLQIIMQGSDFYFYVNGI